MIKGFKMKLYPGQEAEYERRHNLLWPEMKDMIHEHGGKNYTIFLDKETLTLFGYIEIDDPELWAKAAADAGMKYFVITTKHHEGFCLWDSADPELWAKSADTPINRKWWDFMADIMDTNPDNSPVCIDLQNVFHLD